MSLLRLPEIMPLPLHRDVAGLGTDVFRCMQAVDPMTAVLLERPYLPTRVDIREGEEAAGDRARVLRVSRILLTAHEDDFGLVVPVDEVTTVDGQMVKKRTWSEGSTDTVLIHDENGGTVAELPKTLDLSGTVQQDPTLIKPELGLPRLLSVWKDETETVVEVSGIDGRDQSYRYAPHLFGARLVEATDFSRGEILDVAHYDGVPDGPRSFMAHSIDSPTQYRGISVDYDVAINESMMPVMYRIDGQMPPAMHPRTERWASIIYDKYTRQITNFRMNTDQPDQPLQFLSVDFHYES